jgi:hypothetical protein
VIGAKLLLAAIDVGDRYTSYTLPALNVGEVCSIRLKGRNTSEYDIYATLPNSGVYRIIYGAYASDSDEGEHKYLGDASIVKVGSLTDDYLYDKIRLSSNSEQNYYFTAEIIYTRIS